MRLVPNYNRCWTLMVSRNGNWSDSGRAIQNPNPTRLVNGPRICLQIGFESGTPTSESDLFRFSDVRTPDPDPLNKNKFSQFLVVSGMRSGNV